MVTKNWKILTSLVLLLLLSCDNKKTEVTAPSVLLTEEQMIDVMSDVYVLENAINHRRGKGIKVTNLKSKGFDAIFSHYGINDSIFSLNMDYYNENPEKMRLVMDSVNARFQRIQQEQKVSKIK